MTRTDHFAPLANLLLAQHAVDRVGHLRTDDAWLADRWHRPDTKVLPVNAGRVALAHRSASPGEQLHWLTTEQAGRGERYLLGVDGSDVAYFAVHYDPLEEEFETANLRQVAASLDPMHAGLMVHAVALDNWHTTHQFCPRCGAQTRVAVAGAERHCTADGSAHFPRTDPAVIVLVTDPADRALLGRQASWPTGRYSTLAGFVEPGESAEQAAIREISEESSVSVFEVRYLGSQPWPFPASLMLGFTARASGGEAVPDGNELEEVRWFTRAEYAAAIVQGAVVAPGGISIARRLIERWYGDELPAGPAGSAWA